VFKKFGFKALAMVASLGMTTVFVVGCNPAEEPPKPATPPVTAPKPAKADDKKGEAPTPVSPAKDTAKTK
jgi:hypothetical protein